jgi:uncharacterized damage-inducible protein DinB
MRIERSGVLLAMAVILLGAVVPVAARADKPAAAPPDKAASAEPAAPESGARAEFLADYAAVTGKLLQLANAIPAEKYTWRPQEGVRSVSEVLLHASGASYFFPTFLGVAMPTGMDPKALETSTTEKAKVIEALQASVAYGRSVVLRLKDADLEKTGKFFGGQQATYRVMITTLAEHCHEHLGQMIAYARMNGVTPPWSKTQ